ncbi:GNAT family N-acetyltransferase [Hyphomonas sp.]|uniref:GNAT family N-acetyltransferase n=1 Tax=Hyphomonas sp. TaxID=87 RepID=UPI000DFDFB48|nr:GNAT family N-acetyltransferase [Hyphomonas sp.]RCL89637.1 MAG: N-acetyltransferase [Hyphomonas sp.]
MLKLDLPPQVTTASPADWRQIGDITAEAFSEDPINRWIFGTDAAIRATFRQLARDMYLPEGICHQIGDDAATMWALSETRHGLTSLQTFRLVLSLLSKGSKGTVKRALKAGEIMQKYHPTERHLYLFTIGTRKAARGKGLGKTILRPMLDAADRAGLPCYLENSNPANSGFYTSHGFERMKLFEVGEGSPQMEAMWREPLVQ